MFTAPMILVAAAWVWLIPSWRMPGPCTVMLIFGIEQPLRAREQMFERFPRLDARDSREVYAYGLVMFIARRLQIAIGGASPCEGYRKGIGH